MTQKQVVRDFIKVHGDRYDYSLVVYENTRTKVKIICYTHGAFLQKPQNHKLGQGCPRCGKNKKLTQKEVIQQFREVHGDKYDYYKVKYTGTHKKVQITCPIYGTFFQKPSHHKEGRGCKDCYNDKRRTKEIVSNEKVISQFVKVHDNKYDYSKVEYRRDNELVTIICPEHGSFKQQPRVHKQGSGCPKCTSKGRRRLTKNSAIERFKEVHGDKYDYHLVNYKDRTTKVKILCPIHGRFMQRPSIHIMGGGCQKCKQEQSGWCKTSWKLRKNSNSFRSYAVYLIELYNREERFHKIGISSNYVNRFYNYKPQYSVNIIDIVEDLEDSSYIYDLEVESLRKTKRYIYKPLTEFAGSGECRKLPKKFETIETIINS